MDAAAWIGRARLGSRPPSAALGHWRRFCQRHRLPTWLSRRPRLSPREQTQLEDQLVCFLEHLCINTTLRTDTIASYLSGIASRISAAVGESVRGLHGERMWFLRTTLAKLRSLDASRKGFKQPATTSILSGILADGTLEPAVRAACCLAFVCLLRAADYTSGSRTSFRRLVDLHHDDVSFSEVTLSDGSTVDVIRTRVRSAKSDRYNTGSVSSVAFPRSHDGASDALFSCVREYFLTVEPSLPGSAGARPAFRLRDGRHVIRADVADAIKRAATAAGLPPADFSTHSLRIAAAVALADADIPAADIKIAGRWASTAFLQYIRTTVVRDVRIGGALSRRVAADTVPTTSAPRRKRGRTVSA